MKAMKVILPFFVSLMCVIPSFGANMCIRDDALMVVLDPVISGAALASDATGKTWSTKFSYGVISGIAACYTNVGATQGMVASNQTMTPSSTGAYCYCKMLRPVESPWVFSGSNSGSPYYSVNACATNCASVCASYAGSAVALRVGLFGNIGI